MKGTTAGRGLPPAGIFRAGTGEGCGLGRSNCKGYLNLQLDWLLREATARDAGTQLRALTRCAPALDAGALHLRVGAGTLGRRQPAPHLGAERLDRLVQL